MSELYIGLMSGTSVDGIDVALVDLSGIQPKLVASYYEPYVEGMRQDILALCRPGENEIFRLGELEVKLGKAFATAINCMLHTHSVNSKTIRAIGSHGQTVRHHPDKQFTLQIGDPNIIAAETGITTVADFRRRDMALGGQGAPLVPAFHRAVFADKKVNRVILNLGGIANITLLPAEGGVLGFDTGPGNTLLDAWVEQHQQLSVDKNGQWAAQGKVNQTLLDNLLKDPFFNLPPPKSTGREYFNLAWLQNYIDKTMEPVDVQATLVDLTAKSVVNAMTSYMPQGELFICGGGVHNQLLIARLTHYGKNFIPQSTSVLGVDPDSVEAIAFAWLAKQTLTGQFGNLPIVTGARELTVLGGIYLANPVAAG